MANIRTTLRLPREKMKAKIKPKHWYSYLTPKFWRNKKAIELLIDYQINDPKYQKQIMKLVSKEMITGEKLKEEDIIKAVKILNNKETK